MRCGRRKIKEARELGIAVIDEDRVAGYSRYAAACPQPPPPAQGGAHVLHSVADAPAGTLLRVRVADGAIMATSEGLADG